MICKLSNKETDQCPDIYQDCRHCVHGLDIFLREMGVELFEWQRELLKRYIKYDRTVYILPARHQGRTHLKRLVEAMEEKLKGE